MRIDLFLFLFLVASVVATGVACAKFLARRKALYHPVAEERDWDALLARLLDVADEQSGARRTEHDADKPEQG